MKRLPQRAAAPILAVLFALFQADGVWGQDDGTFLSLQQRIIEVYEENRSAVVRVHAIFQNQEEEQRTRKLLGTGFFISREGHVLTNATGTEGAERVWVEHEGVEYAADFLGGDLSTNLSLIQVNTVPEDFNFLHLADSPDAPPVGSMVVRISSLFEFEPSPNLALVTGRESLFGSKLFHVPHLRINIPAGLGESGAPVLDLNGKLVGITVADLQNLQSSYCIPTRAARRVRDDLLFSDEVNYGWLGFEVRTRTTTADGSRIVLREVVPDTPAASSGLLVGDVLLQIGEYAINSISDVGSAIFYARPGQFIVVKVMRGEEVTDYTMRVAERPPGKPFYVAPEGLDELAGDGEASSEGPDDAPEGQAEAESGMSESPAENGAESELASAEDPDLLSDEPPAAAPVEPREN